MIKAADQHTIVDALTRLSAHYDLRGETYRSTAFARGAQVLNNMTPAAFAKFIRDLLTTEDTSILPKHIGKGIANSVREYIATGTMREEYVSTLKSWDELSRVKGAGPAIVKKWIAAGIRTVADLRAHHMDALTPAQRLGVKYYDELNTRIPRTSIEAIYQQLVSLLSSSAGAMNIVLAGSYRRGAESSGDIDILIITSHQPQSGDGEQVEQILKIIANDGRFAGFLMRGYVRASFIWCTDIVKACMIDILFCSQEEYPSALVYLTGSAATNIMLRERAKSMGLRLTHTGLWDGDVRVDAPTEKDIFTRLGFDYIPPENR